MNDPAPHEADDRLLRQLAIAHDRGDLLAARRLTADLLAPYFTLTRNVVRGRIRGVPDPDHDADEITSTVMRRLAHAVRRKQNFGKPFRGVVFDNIKWAIQDYWRQPARKDESVPCAPAELPHPRSEPLPSELDQARTLNERLAGLSDSDREIVLDRLVVGLTPTEIATKRGISRAACDAAFSRAAKRLRASAQMRDVRDRIERSAKSA
jgi:RNA polymerase sigma-70 factor, ECF subfamily